MVAKVLSKRDASFGEDGFSVTLDPYDQGRSGYMFDVNPNGMRSEAIYTDEDSQNWDWEGIWDAASQTRRRGLDAPKSPSRSRRFRSILRAMPGASISRAGTAVDNEQFGWVSYNRTQDLSRTGLLQG